MPKYRVTRGGMGMKEPTPEEISRHLDRVKDKMMKDWFNDMDWWRDFFQGYGEAAAKDEEEGEREETQT